MNTTFECEVHHNNSEQVVTRWSIENFNGSVDTVDLSVALSGLVVYEGTGSFNSILIISEFIALLDGATLYCGSEKNVKFVQYPLRLYRKSTLRTIQYYNIILLLQVHLFFTTQQLQFG